MSKGHDKRQAAAHSDQAVDVAADDIVDDAQQPAAVFSIDGPVPPVDTSYKTPGPSASDRAYGSPKQDATTHATVDLARTEYAFELAHTSATSLLNTHLPAYVAARDRTSTQEVAQLGGKVLALLANVRGAAAAMTDLRKRVKHQSTPGASVAEDEKLMHRHDALDANASVLAPLVVSVNATVGVAIPPNQFRGVDIANGAASIDANALGDDAVFDRLAGEVQRTVQMLALVEDLQRKLIHAKSALRREQLEAARLELGQWASRPLDIAFLHLALGPIWELLDGTATGPADQKPSDLLAGAQKQADKTGWLGDHGRFDINTTAAHLAVGGRDMAELVLADLYTADPDTRGHLLEEMKQRGLLEKMCSSLGWEPIKTLHDSLGSGFGDVKTDLQRYFLGPQKYGPSLGSEWVNHDWSAESVIAHHLGPVGKGINKVLDFGSFGFYSSFGKALDDRTQGLTSEDEARAAENDAGWRSAAVAFAATLAGGAADQMVRGANGSVSLGRAVHAGVAGGAMGTTAGVAASDWYNINVAGTQQGYSSPTDYVKASLLGGAFGGVFGGVVYGRGGTAAAKEMPASGDAKALTPETNVSPYRTHENPRITNAATSAGLDLGTLDEHQMSLVEAGDRSLESGKIRNAAKFFDELAASGVDREVVTSLETKLAAQLGKTSPSVYREPTATLPNGKAVEPSAWGGRYFHGTNEVSPTQAFEHGLAGRGPNTDLYEHVTQKGDSAFRGTTDHIFNAERTSGAGAWAGEGGWVYEIDGTPTWDVNAALDHRVQMPDGSFKSNPMGGEQEHAALANIPPERIVRAYQVVEINGKLEKGPPLENPNYKPVQK